MISGCTTAGYDQNHDDLAGDATSRLSAYLRFGCVSPLEVAIGALDGPDGDEQGEEFCRQLAWRDFFYQVTTTESQPLAPLGTG